MRIKLSITLLIIIAISINIMAQSPGGNKYPKGYFRSPLDISFVLAGSFAELRSNHFHSGIDIKTGGAVGKKVYAVADGYISRIKISPWGYGNAIYINHPNGYTSVYAHLLHYNNYIDSLVKSLQYRRKSFEVEIFPKPNTIKVQKGDIIAISGNSGSSGGPHLHFEIRNTASQKPINPLLFGYDIADHQYPIIKKLRIYSIDNNEVEQFKEYNLKQNRGKVELKNPQTIIVTTSRFYPAVEAIDKWDAAVNKNGIYKLSFYFDDKIFFQFVADKLNFSENRYINSYIDYGEMKATKTKFQRTKVEPNNHLSNLHYVKNSGLIKLEDDSVHKLQIIAEDFKGQASRITINVKRKIQVSHNNNNRHIGIPFYWNEKNTYTADKMSFIIPAKALYSTQFFWTNTLDNPYNNYSKLYQIYNSDIPLHSYCTLKIKPENGLSKEFYSKACIVSIDDKERLIYEGGKFEGDYIVCKTRSFGKYFITIDTIAPIIKPRNIYNNKNISKQAKISFKVTDNLSGIKTYNAYIDNKWILLKYDPKANNLYYDIDSHFKKGKHLFHIVVKDNVGNKADYSYSLIRN